VLQAATHGKQRSQVEATADAATGESGKGAGKLNNHEHRRGEIIIRASKQKREEAEDETYQMAVLKM